MLDTCPKCGNIGRILNYKLVHLSSGGCSTSYLAETSICKRCGAEWEDMRQRSERFDVLRTLAEQVWHGANVKHPALY